LRNGFRFSGPEPTRRTAAVVALVFVRVVPIVRTGCKGCYAAQSMVLTGIDRPKSLRR